MDKPFAGIPAGARLFISSPSHLDQVVSALPVGTTMDPVELRTRLAGENQADATCPMTTAMFLRIVAEAALEKIAAGAEPASVTPFWRVIAPGSTIAKKLTCDGDFITTMRAIEAPA